MSFDLPSFCLQVLRLCSPNLEPSTSDREGARAGLDALQSELERLRLVEKNVNYFKKAADEQGQAVVELLEQLASADGANAACEDMKRQRDSARDELARMQRYAQCVKGYDEAHNKLADVLASRDVERRDAALLRDKLVAERDLISHRLQNRAAHANKLMAERDEARAALAEARKAIEDSSRGREAHVNSSYQERDEARAALASAREEADVAKQNLENEKLHRAGLRAERKAAEENEAHARKALDETRAALAAACRSRDAVALERDALACEVVDLRADLARISKERAAEYERATTMLCEAKEQRALALIQSGKAVDDANNSRELYRKALEEADVARQNEAHARKALDNACRDLNALRAKTEEILAERDALAQPGAPVDQRFASLEQRIVGLEQHVLASRRER